MKLLALILASLLLAQPANAQAEGIFGFVEDVFQFLCNRCKDIITTLDNVIENEPFKKASELDNLCRTFIPEPTLQAICVNIADTILGGVYDQLKRLEPRPEICTSLRLCLECGVPQQTFNRVRRTVIPSVTILNGVTFVGLDPKKKIPTSAPFPAKPTLPNDLFSQFDLNKINADSSSFRHRRATEEEDKEVKEGERGAKETEAGVQLEPHEHSTASSPTLRSKNASEPFDPIQFYGKVAELATTVARLRRMAENNQENAQKEN